MTLHPAWGAILKHAWSVRLLVIAAVLSGLEAVLPVIGYALPVSPLVLALISFAVVASALVARVVCQKELRGIE
jgi:hypothetical protein